MFFFFISFIYSCFPEGNKMGINPMETDVNNNTCSIYPQSLSNFTHTSSSTAISDFDGFVYM